MECTVRLKHMMNIDHLSEEELIHLNRRVVERLKVLEQMRDGGTMGKWL